jgi:thiamine biosynthesis protein ThiS
MLTLTINGEPKTLPEPLTVAQLLERLGHDRRRVAVEINQEVVPLPKHPEHRLNPGDAVEIVTLVGGGSR